RNRARTRDAGDADSGGERLLAIAERRDGWRAVAFIKTPRAKDRLFVDLSTTMTTAGDRQDRPVLPRVKAPHRARHLRASALTPAAPGTWDALIAGRRPNVFA